jgi:hypothetical protein
VPVLVQLEMLLLRLVLLVLIIMLGILDLRILFHSPLLLEKPVQLVRLGRLLRMLLQLMLEIIPFQPILVQLGILQLRCLVQLMLIQPLFWEYDPGIAARTAPDSIDVG